MEMLSEIITLKALLWMILNTQTKGAHVCEEVTKRFCEEENSDQRCFNVYEKSVKVEQAEKICECNSTKLVSIKDEKTMSLLKENIKIDFWINLKRDKLKKFTFVETGMEYENTIDKENEEDNRCAGYCPDSHRIVALHCAEKLPFICRLRDVPTGVVPFKLHTEQLSWFKARERCAENGTLAYPKKNESFTSQLESINMKEKHWIGLHKDEWKWGDGTTMTYSNWDSDSGQPSTVSETCAVSQKAGAWNDVTCTERSHVVCVSGEESASYVPGSTTETTTSSSNPFLNLSETAKYALVAVCAVCGLLIIILVTVLICLCCRHKRRRAQPVEDFRPRAFSQVSKIGVALPTPPGPPARHSLHEGMYDTISLDEMPKVGPYAVGTFQRGRSIEDRLIHPPGANAQEIRTNGFARQNYSHVNRREDAVMSLTYDTVIADNDCYG